MATKNGCPIFLDIYLKMGLKLKTQLPASQKLFKFQIILKTENFFHVDHDFDKTSLMH